MISDDWSFLAQDKMQLDFKDARKVIAVNDSNTFDLKITKISIRSGQWSLLKQALTQLINES